ALTPPLQLAAKVATYVQELIRGYPAQGPPGDPHESWDAVQQQVRPHKSQGAPQPHGCPTAAPLTACPQLSCCGWNGAQDWNHPDGPPGDGDGDGAVACSCLEAPAPNSTHGAPPSLPHGRCPTAAPQDIFPRGCAEGVQGWLAENLVTVVGVCLGIGLLEVGVSAPGLGGCAGAQP
ncbi:CD37 protein, partial [Pelecanoides urinatrix]|nr:CD37 protein [Pelecanoides urinatrix]